MQRYFFITRPDRQHDDSDGTICTDDVGAHEYAERIIRELRADGGYDDPGLTMIVQNAARETLFAMHF
jgi:hypothetical protein